MENQFDSEGTEFAPPVPQSESLREKRDTGIKVPLGASVMRHIDKERTLLNRDVHLGISLLQTICGEGARKSGWHADRPFQGRMVQDDGALFFFDESDRFYADRLRNWQITKIMLMVSELSEGVEELRAGKKANETYYPTGAGEKLEDLPGKFKPEGVPSELADTVIRIMDFCFTEKIDLADMILEKLVFNQTRGQKHGGKTI